MGILENSCQNEGDCGWDSEGGQACVGGETKDQGGGSGGGRGGNPGGVLEEILAEILAGENVVEIMPEEGIVAKVMTKEEEIATKSVVEEKIMYIVDIRIG